MAIRLLSLSWNAVTGSLRVLAGLSPYIKRSEPVKIVIHADAERAEFDDLILTVKPKGVSDGDPVLRLTEWTWNADDLTWTRDLTAASDELGTLIAANGDPADDKTEAAAVCDVSAISSGGTVLATSRTIAIRIENAVGTSDDTAPSATRMRVRGTWDIGTAYRMNDVVVYAGSSYLALDAHTGSTPPSAHWQLLAQKGDTGSGGTAGADAFVYIAYASDASGTAFTTTFNAALAYIAIKRTTTVIASPQASDFIGLWAKYKGTDGATGDAAPLIIGTSTSSVAIGLGTKVFTTQAGLGWTAGQFLIAVYDVARYMVGKVISYSGTTLTLSVANDGFLNTGTFASWTINVSGQRGTAGVIGNTGYTGAGYDGQSTTELTIGTGSKTLTLDGASQFYAYASGQRLRFISTASPSNWIEGTVVRSGLDLTLTVAAGDAGGSGTFSAWTVAVAGEKGAAASGAGIVRGFGILNGYTDAGTPAVDPMPPLALTFTFASIPDGALIDISTPTSGVTLAFVMASTDPESGRIWIDSSGFASPNDCASAIATAFNSEYFGTQSFSASAYASTTSIATTDAGSTVMISGSSSDAAVTVSGGGAGTDFVSEIPPTGAISEVVLMPASGTKKSRTLYASITGTLSAEVRVALKKSGIYTEIAPGINIATFSPGPVRFAPADVATEQLWLFGQDAGESVVAYIAGAIPVDANTANVRYIGDQA